jgi:phosphate/sulfate permease
MYQAPPLPLNTTQLLALVRAGAWAATKQLWRSGIHAITAWTLMAPVGALLIYMILAPLLRRAQLRSIK